MDWCKGSCMFRVLLRGYSLRDRKQTHTEQPSDAGHNVEPRASVMHNIQIRYALPAFLTCLFFSSVGAAQYIEVTRLVTLRNIVVVAVTQDGTTTECGELVVSAVYGVDPELEATSSTWADVWCKDHQIKFENTLTTSAVSHDTNRTVASVVLVTTKVTAIYPNGNSAVVGQDSVQLDLSRDDLAATPLNNTPGIVFRDHRALAEITRIEEVPYTP